MEVVQNLPGKLEIFMDKFESFRRRADKMLDTLFKEFFGEY
jgi:hypothetical protein